MNYSDYDSDGYSSNEDVDYVPSDDNLSEDDMTQCEKEDPLDENDVVPHGHEGSTTTTTKKKKKKGQDIAMRKRKKGGLKLEGEENEGSTAEEKNEELLDNVEDEGRNNVSENNDDDSSQKKKADDLWASFLSDVGSRPKPSPCTPQSSRAQQVEASVSKGPLSSSESAKSSEPSKVTITKVFDFAGEEVRVTKEVSADSKEAKSYLKNQNTAAEDTGEEKQQDRPAPNKPLLPGPSVKRPSGMSSLLNRLGGKKQKMSTLEKSKMDWDAFKSEEGITEELAIHNRGKEGYVERKNFLERVDHRQFEREKAVRLTNMKPT